MCFSSDSWGNSGPGEVSSMPKVTQHGGQAGHRLQALCGSGSLQAASCPVGVPSPLLLPSALPPHGSWAPTLQPRQADRAPLEGRPHSCGTPLPSPFAPHAAPHSLSPPHLPPEAPGLKVKRSSESLVNCRGGDKELIFKTQKPSFGRETGSQNAAHAPRSKSELVIKGNINLEAAA